MLVHSMILCNNGYSGFNVVLYPMRILPVRKGVQKDASSLRKR